MRRARLEERVFLQKPTATADGMGGTEAGWEDVFETRAHFRYLRGSESVMAGRLQGRLTIVATIPTHDDARDVTTDWRMRDARSGTIWNVRSVIPSDERHFLELTCESGVAT
jgi:SPP1 family predicted phage head-tail adaptor